MCVTQKGQEAPILVQPQYTDEDSKAQKRKGNFLRATGNRHSGLLSRATTPRHLSSAPTNLSPLSAPDPSGTPSPKSSPPSPKAWRARSPPSSLCRGRAHRSGSCLHLSGFRPVGEGTMPEQNVELINMYAGFLLLNSCKVNRRGERLYLMCQWRSKMPN